MKNHNKRALYESIMRNISKEVKKVLNEARTKKVNPDKMTSNEFLSYLKSCMLEFRANNEYDLKQELDNLQHGWGDWDEADANLLESIFHEYGIHEDKIPVSLDICYNMLSKYVWP